ncbi:hypothetical protein GJ496_010153 [Pomphorhynchus laevis]|nr:hypothetical protein GJ496_010153 [Pomphorhynchus laevis]
MMSKNQVIRDRAIQQVKDEANIASLASSHPFIVKTYYYWQSKRYLYILSEYIAGGELLQLWARYKPFPDYVVRVYVAEIACVLDFLHQNSIIYRDLKMENILLDERGHVKLIDFGLSKPLQLGHRTSTICGTLQYIAPEVLSTIPYDHAVDWWSLGILTYALIIGNYPYKATGDHVSMRNIILHSTFDLQNANCCKSAKYLIMKLLVREPSLRLRHLDDLYREPFFKESIYQDKFPCVFDFLPL